MKHRLFVYGANPQPFRGPVRREIPLPVTVQELAKIGIPARKIPRVQDELRRLIVANPALCSRAVALALAKRIAGCLV